MRISIFGLGYVGTVFAGCLAADGHETREALNRIRPGQHVVDLVRAIDKCSGEGYDGIGW